MRVLLVNFGIAMLAFFGLLAGPIDPANAQSSPPTIVNYQIQRTEKDGQDSLVFSWEVSNVDRVTLLHDGREIAARTQLADGSVGWPPTMPGAFSTTGATGTYTLIAENQNGRVEARAKFEPQSCLVWLVPPNTHWERCRQGGVIARNLSPTGTTGDRPQCSVEGLVTSRLNFIVTVPNNPFDPEAGTTTHRLDSVRLRRVGSDEAHPLRLSGQGSERRYRVSGLQAGHDYVVGLPWVWRAQPQEITFHCSSSPAGHRIQLETMHNTDFRNDS